MSPPRQGQAKLSALPIQAMQALTNFITLPAQFEANVKDRIRILLMHFDNLRQTIVGLTSVTSKKLYEAHFIVNKCTCYLLPFCKIDQKKQYFHGQL